MELIYDFFEQQHQELKWHIVGVSSELTNTFINAWSGN